jgi:hypothetical protein
MNTVPLHENERLHLRMPPARQMAEMRSGKQQLLQRHTRHFISGLVNPVHQLEGPSGEPDTRLRSERVRVKRKREETKMRK